MPGANLLLQLQGVSWWPAGGAPVLAELDWQVRDGEHWALLGPNGAGKSTLLAIAGAQRHPSRGGVHLLGATVGRVDLRELRARVGVVDPRLRVPAALSVREYVLTGATGTVLPLPERVGAAERRRAERLIADLGVLAIAEHRCDTCSQGELARARLARALLADPPLLLLDEPTAGLDLPGRERLLLALRDAVGAGHARASVFVAHHLEDLPASTTHALLLRGGRQVAAGPVETTLTAPLLSECFGLPLTLRRNAGRWQAHA